MAKCGPKFFLGAHRTVIWKSFQSLLCVTFNSNRLESIFRRSLIIRFLLKIFEKTSWLLASEICVRCVRIFKAFSQYCKYFSLINLLFQYIVFFISVFINFLLLELCLILLEENTHLKEFDIIPSICATIIYSHNQITWRLHLRNDVPTYCIICPYKVCQEVFRNTNN